MSFAKTDLERIDEPLTNFLVRFQAIDQNECVIEIIERIILGLLKLDHFAVSKQSRESLLQQKYEISRDAQLFGFCNDGFLCLLRFRIFARRAIFLDREQHVESCSLRQGSEDLISC